jgi:hypothetical protein
VLGHVVTVPGTAPSHIEDRRNTLVVELANGAMLLHDADAAALAAGTNLAMVGEELLQFAHALPLGARQWRLSGLWRGRRGTESAIGGQSAGNRFVLLGADALVTQDLSIQAVGSSVRVLAQGVGDEDAAEAAAAMSGISIVPPAPVHLRIVDLPDGSAEVRWVRRSRSGWDWIDGVDAPLGEESERYQVAIARTEGPPQIVETAETRFALTAGERVATIGVVVRQIGSHGLSPPAALELA